MNTDQSKYSGIHQLLTGSESAFVLFTPDVECILPVDMYDDEYCNLQIGYDMPIPIPDLMITGEGFAGTLSFKGKPFHCFVPWKNVFAIHCPRRALGCVYDRARFDKFCVLESSAGSNHRNAIRPPPLKVAVPAERPSYLQVVDGERKKSFFDNVKRGPLADRSHLRVVQS